MGTLTVQLWGILLFVAGTGVVGRLIRRCPSQEMAERTSRFSHLLYWAGLVLPWVAGFLVPGSSRLDRLIGLSLPTGLRPLMTGAGLLLLCVGMYFSLAANVNLVRWGGGTAAFKLTKAVVGQGVYRIVRNPMSLGYYLVCLSLSLVAGSTYYTLLTALGVIPAHVFNLKFFEEKELRARYGTSYEQYRKEVPFIIPRFLKGAPITPAHR